jgi:anthraniloyl-CoA monooxygenase
MTNANHIRGSAWIRFPRVLCERWSYDNIVLMGDAAATAHFSIGSGTKLALESAIALANYLHSEPTLQKPPFDKYEDERRLEVLRLQSAARNSMEWFEEVERYFDLDPVQFNYSLLTRSQRISHENLRMRDAEWLEERRALVPDPGRVPGRRRSPRRCSRPTSLREMELKNRIVVSPMAQYKAVDGCPTDWHLVHYGERAKGGAGLVYTEMTCVSRKAGSRRVVRALCPGTRGCLEADRRFHPCESEAKVCMQIGHAGAKGSTQLGWEDHGCAAGGWQLAAAGGVRCGLVVRQPDTQGDDREDMDQVRDQFVAAAEMAERAGFDMIELHMPRTAICCRPSSRR